MAPGRCRRERYHRSRRGEFRTGEYRAIMATAMPLTRAYRAGESLEDLCRACKADRLHTVIAVDADGVPIRVVCGYCHSEHNYRGGPGTAVPRPVASSPLASDPRRASSGRAPFPIVSDRERTSIMAGSEAPAADLEVLLRRIIREE